MTARLAVAKSKIPASWIGDLREPGRGTRPRLERSSSASTDTHDRGKHGDSRRTIVTTPNWSLPCREGSRRWDHPEDVRSTSGVHGWPGRCCCPGPDPRIPEI